MKPILLVLLPILSWGQYPERKLAADLVRIKTVEGKSVVTILRSAVIAVNGVDLRTGKKLSRGLWSYDTIVPEINEYYADEEEDERDR